MLPRRFIRNHGRILLSLLVAVCALPTSPLAQSAPEIVRMSSSGQSPVLAHRAAQDDKLDAVMRRLADGAGPGCANRWRRPGFKTHSLGDYSRGQKGDVQAVLPELGQEPQVWRVENPDLAKLLQPGDKIIGSQGRVLAHTDIDLQVQLALGRLKVARMNERFTIVYDIPLACYRPVHVTDKGTPAARTRVDGIEISRGMMEVTRNEHELAFVLAHELSHMILGHPQIIAIGKANGSMNRRQRRTMELDADSAAAIILVRSGFDPAASHQFVSRMNTLHGISFLGLSNHPARKARLRNLNETLEAIVRLKALNTIGTTSPRDFVNKAHTNR